MASTFYTIPSAALITMEMANAILTDSDWEAAKKDDTPIQSESAVPVRVTMAGDANIVEIERITDRTVAYADTGKNPMFGEDSVTFDALLCFGDGSKFAMVPGVGMPKGEYAFLNLLPMSQSWSDPDSIKGYVNEHFDIKHIYLPCPLGTVAGEKICNMSSGYAYVDAATQQVIDITIDNSVKEADYGIPVKSDHPDYIKVPCRFANGGCNFMKVSKREG
mgnify:CR=1 FL=1|tara:strand:- start:64 stop:723 length:660 start_codon:yes stop_codon:yes gene_type:complete